MTQGQMFNAAATVMPATHAQESCTRKWYQKPAQKSDASSSQFLAPITLHGSSHVQHSFCDGIKLCSILCKKLVPEKTENRSSSPTKVRHINWQLADAREYLLTSVASTVSRRIFIYICVCLKLLWREEEAILASRSTVHNDQ